MPNPMSEYARSKLGNLDDSGRQWLNNGSRYHIRREHPPERWEAMLVRSRPGSIWTYCGREAHEDYAPLGDPAGLDMAFACRVCLAAWYADENV